MDREKFNSRSGCLDYGNSYEFLMAAYYGLRLSLNETVSDFKVSTNNNDMGNFDDVVLEIKYKDGNEELYALQLKHRGAKEDSITLQAFDAEKGGKFGLKKYCEGFKQTEEKCKGNSSYNLPFEKFYFILYTNQVLPKFHTHNEKHQKVESDEVQLKSKVVIYKYDQCIAKGLIDLSETDSYFIYKFRNGDKSKLDESFLNQFVLYTKQKDAQEIECRISKFICRIFENCDSNVIDNYINFFKFWWRGDYGNYKLTKRDIMLKLSEYVLTPHIPEIFIPADSTKFDILNECFANFDITVIKDCNDSIVWGAILKDDFSPLSDSKNIPISAQGSNFVDQSLKQTYVIWWHMDKLPLFVKISDKFRSAIYAAIKLCENFDKKKKFIIFDENFDEEEFDEEIKILQNLSDITKDLQEKICREIKVSFQGREAVGLNQIVSIDDRFRNIITMREIIHMLDGHFIIGNNDNNLPKHYISRFCTKILLDSKSVDEIDNVIFVISSENTPTHFKSKIFELNKYLLMKNSASATQFPNKIIVSVNQSTEQEFRKICLLNPNKNCHLCRVVKKGTLEWIQSQGSINSLRPYLDCDDFIKDTEIVKYFSNRINIMCAPPGMGKSVMMNFLKHHCPSDYWVISINLNDHVKFFKSHHELEEILFHFMELEIELSQKFIHIFASIKKILFLWDGFDELPGICISGVISTIKLLYQAGFVQWISARNSSKEFLENTFSTLSVTLTQFSESDQREFIYNNLKEKFSEQDVEEMVSKLNENMSSSLSCGYFDYSGVPLQISMVTEIFLKNPEKEFKIVTLTDIYQEFIDGRFVNLFERANANQNNHLMQKIQKRFKENRLSKYEIAAVNATFDEETFTSLNLNCDDFMKDIIENRDPIGLIVSCSDDNKPVFSHKTYQEFLAASWLVKNYQNNLVSFLFQDDLVNVRLMFDMILAKDSPVHIAVLYRNLPVLNQHKKDILGSKDKGGRNPLQVACSWGMKHPLVKIVQNKSKTIIAPKEIHTDSNENVEIVKFLLSCEGDPWERDQLLKFSAFEYADQTLSLAHIEAMLLHHEIDLNKLKNFTDVDTLLYYSIKFNYEHIFSKLTAYPYAELIIDNQEVRTLLQFAVQMDRTDFVRILLTLPHYQEVINKPYKDLGGPLFSAAANGNMEMFNLLREHGAILGKNQISPLITAVALGYDVLCEKLLREEKMDPNECNIDGNSVLQIAALRNHLGVMKILLDCGANVRYINYFDLTALDYCIENRSFEGVELLVQNGADLNRQGFTLYGYTPLHNACELGEVEIIKFMLKSGANPTIKSNRQYTPLHVALINKQEEVAKILVEADPSVINEYSEEKSTATMLAALENFHNLIETFARLGADLDSAESKDSPLRIATLKKFEKTVEVLIKCGASVNRPDIHGFSPLFYAITNENLLKLFLDNPSTDVNVRSNELLVTALHFAAENGKVFAVEGLIKHGADVNAKDGRNHTPLHYALSHKHEDVVKCLLKNNARMEDSIGLINRACITDSPDCLLTLINYGVDLNEKDEQGRNSMHYAAATSLYCVKLLVFKGVDVNHLDNFGFSPLCFAIYMGKIEIILELLANGANIKTGFGSSSALHLSAGLGDVPTLILLLSLDCDVNCKEENGRTPLHCTVDQIIGAFYECMIFLTGCGIKLNSELNFQSCAKELIEIGADITARNNSGLTPLVNAVVRNKIEMLKLLYESFQHRDDLEDEWLKCFCCAANNNFLEILHFLSENKTDLVNKKEKNTEMRALHYACIGNAYDAAAFLIKNGADINARTVDGFTPLYFCACKGYLNVVQLLIENGAEIDISNGHGNTPLFGAAAQGFLDVVIFLSDRGADIEVVDDDGDTPLHDASANGHSEVVAFLVGKDVNVSYKNKSGKTPLDLAKNEEIIKMLHSKMCGDKSKGV